MNNKKPEANSVDQLSKEQIAEYRKPFLEFDRAEQIRCQLRI